MKRTKKPYLLEINNIMRIIKIQYWPKIKNIMKESKTIYLIKQRKKNMIKFDIKRIIQIIKKKSKKNSGSIIMKTEKKRIEYQKEYYKRNKNKIIAYTYEWQKTHSEIQKLKKERRKIREECNSYAQDQWYECISFFDNKCAYSGEDCLPYTVDHVSDSITIDHIVPLSQGGLNVIWNIVPAKFKYNSSKGNKNLEDWYSQQEFFSEDRLNKIYQWVEYAYNKYGMESSNI